MQDLEKGKSMQNGAGGSGGQDIVAATTPNKLKTYSQIIMTISHTSV